MACAWLHPFPRPTVARLMQVGRFFHNDWMIWTTADTNTKTRLAGAIPAIAQPAWFIQEQITQHVPVPVVPSSEGALLVTRQLGNAFGLLAMCGVGVLYTTNEPKVVRNYLVALWIADIGHIALTYFALRHDRFMAFGSWNAMTWGNVFVTVGQPPLYLENLALVLILSRCLGHVVPD
ncbi:hypothetical protein OOU_Y34scaffold00666g39 [Pyricularia oryzae Y34]|uniref:DUF7704 domain-containing protein n=3 Tax=Pyricularia oryzae TaxID=318829 RepID=Q2KG43_PYRO7|nr:hypothetical protein MGCH7_ch7g492 [Pyricularia oryzae 70-15]ELQ36178.1 hypothetical protein OOU_Y34scaffold00666g39 [Pyricularia oryzae Y34]